MSIDWFARASAVRFRTGSVISGELQGNLGGEAIVKYGPRDGGLLYRTTAARREDVDGAVRCARKAFEDGRWSRAPLRHRRDVLSKWALLIERNREELALLECLEVGKPIADALAFDVPAAVDIVRYNAEVIEKVASKVYGSDGSSLSFQLQRPIGVVAAIVGWNFPLVLASTKVAPALAVGNSVVLKPSELTSLSAVRIAELAVEAGVPEDVFNVVHGAGEVGGALTSHGDVDLVTFTGSSATGKKILVASGQSNMKRLLLECGGKAPNIVFDDAGNLEGVAEGIVQRAFWNQGQVCTASSRLLVHEGVREKLLPLLVSKASALRPGDPLDPLTGFGAVVSEEHKKKIVSYIDGGEGEGATLLHLSSAPPPNKTGFYVQPAIFDHVSSSSRMAQEEIFGPVLSVMTFRDEVEAIRKANDTIYGLSAILWTRDLGRAHRVTQGIKAGWIVVNATDRPTGGPSDVVLSMGGLKQSGVGAEGGIEGLQTYMSQTAVQYFV